MILRQFLILSFFVLIGFRLNVNAETVDRVTVVRLLQEDGPINWVPYSQTAEERGALFALLSDIVRNPSDLTTAIQNRALSESGKFSKDESGNLTDDARRLYDEQITNPIRNSNDTALRMSLIQGLENAYIPESVDYLLKAAEQDDQNELNENSTSLAAVDALRMIMKNDPEGRPPLPDTDEFRFDARIGTPMGERQRALEWMAAAKKAVDQLDDLIRRGSSKKLLEKKLKSIREIAEKFLVEGKAGMDASKSTKKESGESDLNPTSFSKKTDQKDLSSGATLLRSSESAWIYYSVLGITTLLISIYIYFRRRRASKNSSNNLVPPR